MIPEHTRAALDRYVNQRIFPGSFLIAVLSNDLFGAMAKADFQNQSCLRDICEYIYNELPSNCWGSHDLIYKWVEKDFYNRLA